MKEIIISIAVLLFSNAAISQKMITRSGEIKFEASMPAFEEIAATNNTVSCIFDKATGEFVTLALVKAFRFKTPLMEEHFNENYVESSQFPKSTFKGQVLNFDGAKLSGGKAVFDLEGDLTLHGITKRIKTKITFAPSGNKLIATSNFSIRLKDFNIKIPNVVKDKIDEEVKIALAFPLENK